MIFLNKIESKNVENTGCPERGSGGFDLPKIEHIVFLLNEFEKLPENHCSPLS
jgi:hypothetical protein